MTNAKRITGPRLLDDARDLALTLKAILDQQPTTLSGLVADGSLDHGRLPDWFTGANQGRILWNGGE